MGKLARPHLDLIDDLPELLEVTYLSEIEEQKLLELYQNLEFLKRELNSRVVSEIKQCNVACREIKNTIGELNDSIKKSK